MTLRLTLAGLLVLALACGGGESTPTPDGDPPPPPPPADGGGADGGGDVAKPPPPEKPDDLGSAAKPLVDKAKAEAEAEAGIEWQTKEVSTTVKLPPAQRTELKETGTKLLEAEARKDGYDSVVKVKLGKPSCDGDWCTATVTGTARKAVKKEAAEGEAAEGEAAEGEAKGE